jgi:hypothetical protein
MTPQERARIATTYGVTVPDSVTVQVIPRGASQPEPARPRDAFNTMFKVRARAVKFARAAKKVSEKCAS